MDGRFEWKRKKFGIIEILIMKISYLLSLIVLRWFFAAH